MKFCPSCLKCFEQALNLCPDDQAALAESPPQALVVAGKYRIERLISRGRNVVCEGTQIKTQRPVAIKLILADVPERAHQKALGVACLSTRIDHQHVVETCGYGQLSGGLTYVVTELVGGKTLREHLRDEGHLAATEATLVARQVADGLAAAHSCGVVHGGLNPSNIILARDFHGGADAKVFNLGLSECSTQASGSGSPDADDARRYLSPEQLSGRGADERSDVYSLGVVLHEMLTGRASCARLVFRGEDSGGEGTSYPETCCEHAPGALSALLADALHEKPSARLQSASEFARRLRLGEYPGGHSTPPEPEPAPPVSGGEIHSQSDASPPTPPREASVSPPHVVKSPVRKIGLVDDYAVDVTVNRSYRREECPAGDEGERTLVVEPEAIAGLWERQSCSSDESRGRSGSRGAQTPFATHSQSPPPAHARRALALALPALLILTLGAYGWHAFKHKPSPSSDTAAAGAPNHAAHMTESALFEPGNAGGMSVEEAPSLLTVNDDEQAADPVDGPPRQGVEERGNADVSTAIDLSISGRGVMREAAAAKTVAGVEVAPTAFPAPATLRPERVTGERCIITTSRGTITLHSNGGSGEIAVGFNNEPSGAGAVTAATGDWSNIAVLAAAPGGAPGGSVYQIVSVSGRAGTYYVTFNSPCGARRVAVNVE